MEKKELLAEKIIELVNRYQLDYIKELEVPEPQDQEKPTKTIKPKKQDGKCPNCSSKKIATTNKPDVVWCLKCHKEFII